jgi:hypothetical protein
VHRLPDLVPDGLIDRAQLVASTSPTSVKRWLRTGAVVQVQPGVLALPESAGDWGVRARAAIRWAGGPLSHISALVAGGLTPPDGGPLHVTVPNARCPRGGSDVLAHRSDRRMVTVRYGRLEAVEPERSLVDAWAWAHTPRRNPRARQERPVIRRAIIEGVRSRAVQVAAIRRAALRRGPHPGGPALLELLALVAGGCDSELEIWGVQHVLPGPPTVPPYVQQHAVVLPDGRRIKLDAAWLEARVAVELDGAAFHGSREARERDLRRDTALAAAGWIVLRFSYARLMADPEGCRREIVAAVLARLAH